MYHKPLTWYEKENWGYKAEFLRPSPQPHGCCDFTRSKLDHKDHAYESYGTLHAYIQNVQLSILRPA
jgi:hypothetical protein